MVAFASLQDIVCKTYYDSGGNPVDIFILTGEQFVSEYQGRIYTDNIFNAYGPDGVFQDELLWEFVSEVFREYIQNPDRLEKEFPKFYELIKEAVE